MENAGEHGRHHDHQKRCERDADEQTGEFRPVIYEQFEREFEYSVH